MSPATLAPPSSLKVNKDSRQKPFRWTIAQYRELGKLDVFHDLKTMLLDGEIYAMVMPSPPHDTALGLTENWLRSVFATGYHIRCQMGFDIGTHNDPGPDLAIVPGTIRDYSTRTPTTAVLVVEIAESSLFLDTTTKAELYATAGVPDYWVIDLENRELVIFRDPEPLPEGLGATAYRTRSTLGPDDSISPLAAPSFSVKISDLLP